MSEARALRYDGRHALRQITTVSRCFDCGREPHGSAVGVRQTAENVVGFAGLVSCGRIWLCPVCNAKVMARRAVEIGAALTWATVEGHQVIWGSLTVRHNASSDLAQLLELQRSAWRYVVSSKWWRALSTTIQIPHAHDVSCAADCERTRDVADTGATGRIGYIRAAEVTIGVNGWHPHFHPLLIVRGSAELAQQVAEGLVARWVEAVEYYGGEARIEGGQQLRVLDARGSYDALAGYITKATYDPARLALESVWSQGKTGRGRAKSTSSHWSLLAAADIQSQGYDRRTGEVGRWWELESAITGHRMISWSRGLRQFVGLALEVDDETVAAEEVGTKNDTVCYITSDGWLAIRDDPALLVAMLDVLEGAGWAGLQALLDGRGVEYYTLETAPAI